MARRSFKIKMRPGYATFGATNDGTPAPNAGSGEEVVVSEDAAAFLVRQHAAKVVEVIEEPTDHAQED